MTISAGEKIEKIIDSIGRVQTIWGLGVFVFLVLVFILCVFTFTRAVNKKTKKQVQRFEKEGKYFPQVYIELDNSMESLRYFLFSYRWKRRVIRQYNHLFRGYEAQQLRKILGPDVRYRLSYLSSFSKLNSTLSEMYNRLKRMRNERSELSSVYGEMVWRVSNSTYNYIYAVEYLRELSELIYQKNVILVGSAGNGKTNQMCRLSEIAVTNKIPCLLVNSRDIKENCTDYILNQLPLLPKLKKLAPLYLRIVSILLLFKRKNFFILIDAINENDREEFADSISTLLDSFSKYSRIRIFLSCRSEYFDTRYHAFFSACENPPYIFSLHDAEYDERAMEKMIEGYKRHFNVRGYFSNDMRSKLQKSLLLTRIFFEVNCNRDQFALEFHNAEIFKQYIEKIASENANIDFKEIVYRIAECMFNAFSFDKVSVNALNLPTAERNAMRQILDNNLIISRVIQAGTDITEREEEYVYFVFDELRDFCLARYLLTQDEKNKTDNFILSFSNISKLYAQRLSPTEGVIKFAYHYFRKSNRNNFCQKLLETFGESDTQMILASDNWQAYEHRNFSNFGISLILSEGGEIAPFEMKYILDSIQKAPQTYWELFWYLLRNEIAGNEPAIELAVDILASYKNNETPTKILDAFFSDRTSRYYYRPEKSRADILNEVLIDKKRRNEEVTSRLKILVAILAAHDISDWALLDYHDFVMDESLFAEIQEKGFCGAIMESLVSLKEQQTPGPMESNQLQTIFEFWERNGYFE